MELLFGSSSKETIKLAFIGTGLRGQDHIDLVCRRKDVQVQAICDINPVMIEATKKVLEQHKKPIPTIYTGSDFAWLDLDRKSVV